jgi:hypothetical protein
MAQSFALGQTVTRGILRLSQGFMALGLLVGIAALGVIASRTVVERRQQVGVLCAFGFHPGMVALCFRRRGLKPFGWHPKPVQKQAACRSGLLPTYSATRASIISCTGQNRGVLGE